MRGISGSPSQEGRGCPDFIAHEPIFLKTVPRGRVRESGGEGSVQASSRIRLAARLALPGDRWLLIFRQAEAPSRPSSGPACVRAIGHRAVADVRVDVDRPGRARQDSRRGGPVGIVKPVWNVSTVMDMRPTPVTVAGPCSLRVPPVGKAAPGLLRTAVRPLNVMAEVADAVADGLVEGGRVDLEEVGDRVRIRKRAGLVDRQGVGGPGDHHRQVAGPASGADRPMRAASPKARSRPRCVFMPCGSFFMAISKDERHLIDRDRSHPELGRSPALARWAGRRARYSTRGPVEAPSCCSRLRGVSGSRPSPIRPDSGSGPPGWPRPGDPDHNWCGEREDRPGPRDPRRAHRPHSFGGQDEDWARSDDIRPRRGGDGAGPSPPGAAACR